MLRARSREPHTSLFTVPALLQHRGFPLLEVRLSITGPCGRCVMTTLAQGDLPPDPGILRTAAQHNKVSVGIYATVERGGSIHRGDAVRVE
jgi:uncharacterized protein YcbX